jgi:hypothetical protein
VAIYIVKVNFAISLKDEALLIHFTLDTIMSSSIMRSSSSSQEGSVQPNPTLTNQKLRSAAELPNPELTS